MEVKPILSFGFDFELLKKELELKGYCSDVYVTLPDQRKYNLLFLTPFRVDHEIGYKGYIADPGLILIQDITIKHMEDAVFEVWLDGFFEHVTPISQTEP